RRVVRGAPRLLRPPQDRDGCVEALAGDEARRAELEAVPLHEPLQPWAVRGRADEAPEGAHACQSRTIRSSSFRSEGVRPRSGAQTSAVTGTPRNPSAVF